MGYMVIERCWRKLLFALPFWSSEICQSRFNTRWDMPCCPSCGKGYFKDAASVAMHMSQPTSGCNNWINDLVHLQEELDFPSASMSGDPHPSASHSHSSDLPATGAYHNDPDAMSINAHDLYEPFSVPNTLIEDHFLGAAQTFGEGQTFLDKFNMDKFSLYRRENMYYPFASRLEWQLALWLLHSGISMSAIDEFLSLKIVSFSL